MKNAIGGKGNLQYAWYSSTSSSVYDVTDNSWTLVIGAENASYQPALLSTTTYFVRLAKRAACSEW